jgi:uncharacterized membrane protein YgcG
MDVWLIFSIFGLCPNIEKIKPHVQKTSFTAVGGVTGSPKLLYTVHWKIAPIKPKLNHNYLIIIKILTKMANLISLSIEGINVLLPEQTLLVRGGCKKKKKKSRSNSGSRSGRGGSGRPRGGRGGMCGGGSTTGTGAGGGGTVTPTPPPVVIADQA